MSKFTPKCSFTIDLYKMAEKDIEGVLGKSHIVWGHVRSIRTQSNLSFISIYDGTHMTPIQCLVEFEKTPELQEICQKIHVSSYLKVKGVIVKSPAKGQLIEMQIKEIEIAGAVNDTSNYLPMAKGVNLDSLRGKNSYLRPKFQTYMAVYTIRDKVDKFINDFMRQQDFKKLDPNILTASDCEGAGEMFVVSTLLKDEVKDIPQKEITKDKKVIDYSKDFFFKKVGLTVSSQLQLEALVPLGKGVYTMNKSFRAEKSKTSRHLAEFTHLEWESKIVDDLTGLMDFNEDLVTYVIKKTLEECNAELQSLNGFVSKGIIDRLKSFVKEDFARISYTEAVDLITQNKDQIMKLNPELTEIPKWGDDLGAKCERYLGEIIYKKPLFVYNYPRDLKSFYMKQNPPDEEGRYTVQGCDLLIPYMGELIGSSVREENYDLLTEEMKRRGMDVNTLSWYVDLRKNGGCRTSGAGLGFERLVQILCYMDSNIRDVIPFPVSFEECYF